MSNNILIIKIILSINQAIKIIQQKQNKKLQLSAHNYNLFKLNLIIN